MRSFSVDAIELADGPVAASVIEALLVFDPEHEIREQLAPLREAIDRADARGIARVVLATIRATFRYGRSAASVGWPWAFKQYWAAPSMDAGRCMIGLDASIVLLSRLSWASLRDEAQTRRDALARAGISRAATRSARAWGRRSAHRVELAAATFWADGAPSDPDWKVLGDPAPTPRVQVGISSRFPLPE